MGVAYGEAARRRGTAAHRALLLATTAVFGMAGALPAQAAVFTVTSNADDGSAGTLRYAINQANVAGGTNTINFSGPLTITLQSNLPLVASSVQINAAGSTIDGGSTYRGFLISGIAANGTAAATTIVGIQNLTIRNVTEQGGNTPSDAFASGGGGLGAGGAVFVGPAADVTLTNVNVSHATAVGGAAAATTGGSSATSGGGGLGGNGGGGGDSGAAGGGGGLFFAGGNGPSNGSGGGGGGGITGAGADGSATKGGNGGAGLATSAPTPLGGGGGGGGGSTGNGNPGGTGAGTGTTAAAGAGGFGGGGGGGSFGANLSNAGNGGFGGGGGGALNNGGGQAGFGGGGGGSAFGGGGTAGFGGGGGGGGLGGGPGGFAGGDGGGGSGGVLGGGGGGALGGAIFVAGGGTLTINGASSQSGGAVTGGAGTDAGNNGRGFGGGIFYQGTNGTTSTLNIGAGNQTIANAIADYIGVGGTNPGGGTNVSDQGGSLALTKSGTGTLTLTGANVYSGATTVNGGMLEVDGSIASPNVTVNNGATLSGVGTIGDPVINAGGTLSPGNAANPYGTLTIVGPLTFAAGSFYNISITPTQNSRTNVVGTTTIQGGTVNVAAGSGNYRTRRYTILNATGGVTGTFTAVTTNLAFLMPTLTYDPNNVYLNITGTGTYTTAARTQNQLHVAEGLTEAGKSMPGGAGGRVLDGLNQLTVAQAQAAFDALSGEGITATQNLANRSAQLFNDAIFDQTTFYGNGGAGNQIVLTGAPPAFMAYAPLYGPPVRELADLPAAHIAPVFVAPTRTWRAWATGFGGTEDIHGDGAIGSAAQDNTIYGGALGVDYQLMPNYLVGVAVGGSQGDFRVPMRTTYGSTTGGHVAIYDLATFGAFYGASSSSFSYYNNRTTRFVGGFGGLGNETERGDFDSHEYRTRLEFGRHFDGFGLGTLTPFVALEIAELRSNGFGETVVAGPGFFRLNVSGQSAADAPGYVGLRFQNLVPLGGMAFLPSLQVAYVHEFAPYRSQTGALADLPGSTFLIDGARPARDAAQVKAGGELKIGPNSALFANFDGEFSGVNQLYAGKGGFRWVW